MTTDTPNPTKYGAVQHGCKTDAAQLSPATRVDKQNHPSMKQKSNFLAHIFVDENPTPFHNPVGDVAVARPPSRANPHPSTHLHRTKHESLFHPKTASEASNLITGGQKAKQLTAKSSRSCSKNPPCSKIAKRLSQISAWNPAYIAKPSVLQQNEKISTCTETQSPARKTIH